MAKNTSASRERRERALQLARAQKKKERIIRICSIIAIVAIIAAATLIVIFNLPKEEPPAPPTKHLADDQYAKSDEVTNFVKLNISYTDANGVSRVDDIVVELDPENAPITVANFQKLVGEEFYNGLVFHRVIEGFMIQGGGYKTDGSEKEADTIKGEFSENGVDNGIKHVRGTISMARTDVYDSASSQFFIVHETSDSNTGSLDGKYAAFGWVVFGMETVDRIAVLETNDNNILTSTVKINSATFVTEK
ncbi:MAG: peptidylprolyl isomerase [Clostridia bacterium]|nr:peptidylprolyl isomerase [Clostridia bacterium]